MKTRIYGTLIAAVVALTWNCTPAQREDIRDEPSGSDPGNSVGNTEGDTAGKSVVASRDTRCAPDGGLVDIPDVPEASGLAASTRSPGLFWTINDTGEALIYAIDADGADKGRVKVRGAKVKNWEAVGVGPCLAGSCLYIGDIGDNSADRKDITVYRVPEPLPGDSVTAEAQVFHGRYPNGPQDAEAMWVTAKREVYIVTKGETGSIAVYRFPPASARNGASVVLDRITRLEGKDAKRREMVTDASLSPDGKSIVMRTKTDLLFYDAHDLAAGRPIEPSVVDLTSLKEPQGEGVTFGAEGLVYLAGEGGGKGRPGTLAALRCEGSPSSN